MAHNQQTDHDWHVRPAVPYRFSGNRNIKSLEAVHGRNHFAHAGMNGIPLAAC